MAFNAGTIKATLKLDSSSFKAGVEATKTQLSGLKSTITSTSFLLNTVLASGVILATKKLIELGEQGERLKLLEGSFYSLARASGQSGNQIVGDVKRISGELTNVEIMKAADTLELLGVGMAKLPQLTSIASATARALGQETGEMLQALVAGTARQSDRFLQMVGIMVDSKKATEEYARAHGKLAKDLDETEMRAAFLNAVLRSGSDIIQRLGPDANGAAEGFQNFSASMVDLSNSLKMALADLSPFFNKLAQMVNWGNQHGIWLKRGVGIMFSRPEPSGPYGTLPGGGPSMFQQAAAQMRAEAEARAQQGRINAPVGGVGARVPEGFMGPPAPLGGIASLLQEPGLTQSQQALDYLSEKFFRLQDVALGFGDAISTAFHTLITDSKNAAKAFASAFLSSIGRVASNLGDLLITSAIGFEALGNLAWPLALGMGFALKALGGMLSGLGQKSAPAGMTSAYAPPTKVEGEAMGGVTFVIQGDFNGDPAWIDRLAEKLRLAGRDRGVKVVYEGA